MFDFNQLYKPQKIRITEAFDFNDIEDDFDIQPEYSNNMTLPLYVMNRLKTMAKITYEERRDKADMFKLMYEQLNDYLNKPENSVFNIFNMLIKDGCDPVVRSAKASSFKHYGYYEKALSLQIGFDCTKNTKLASYPVEVLYLLYVLNFEYTAGCYDTTLQTHKLAEFNFRKQVGIKIRMNEGYYIEWDGDKGRMTDETYMVMEQMVDDAISYCKPNMCSGDLVDAIRLKNTITDTTEYTDE